MVATLSYPLPFSDRSFPPWDGLRFTPGVGLPPRSSEVVSTQSSLLNWVKSHIGISLDASERVGRLLMLHWMAVKAESDGGFLRADFFWHELYNDLARIWNDDRVWISAATMMSRPAAGTQMDAEELRARLIAEVFIETHCAFYNGYLQAAETLTADNRAFTHARLIGQVLDLAKISNEAADALRMVPARAKIEILRDNLRWEEAIKVCDDLLQHLPNLHSFQDELVDLHYGAAMQSLHGGESQSDNAADASRMRRVIDSLESARRKFSRNLNFYRALGECHRILAVKLANAGELADALAAVRLAQKYDPYLEEAVRTKEQLTTMMTQLQREVIQLQAQLAQQPGTQLNSDGQRLLRNAQAGFEPLNKIEDSALAVSLANDFQQAQARDVWLSIGLPEPVEGWEERALALLNAVVGILSDPPAQPEHIASALSQAMTGNAELTDIDLSLVETFLRHHLFDTGEPAPTSPVASSSIPLAAPVAKVAIERRSLEPFDYWLFSRQDLRVKAQALVAVGILSLAGILYLSDSHNRELRDQAYRMIHQAASAGADRDILRAAESFLSAGIRGGDEREEEVRRQYEKAFSRWFVADGHELNDDARVRIARFRELVRE